MLVLDIQPGQSVAIGNDVVVTLKEKSGKSARIAFDAPKSVAIRRTDSPARSPAHIGASMGITGR